MLEEISLSILGYMFGNLKEFAVYNYKLISGLDEKVKTLLDHIDSLTALDKEYTRHNTDDAAHQKRINDVTNLVHKIEDAIEQYFYCLNLQQKKNPGDKALHALGYIHDLRDVGKLVEALRSDVETMLGENENLKAVDFDRVEKKEKLALNVETDNMVGFEDEFRTVYESLTGKSKALEIVSITGMLGLGKTSLAMKVLNDSNVKFHFTTRVFVNVSKIYDRRGVFTEILNDMKCKIDPDISDKQILQILQEELGKRKYLIVMDDVWTTDAWDDLKVAFPNNKMGSRILITSRRMDVATYANPSRDPHVLRLMTDDESRKLLRTRVFGKNACSPHLQQYESQILVKCGNLPLAIVVVAGILLKGRKYEYRWKQVALGVGDNVSMDESPLTKMIKLSYYDLPYHLKACFLYLGVFSKGFEIPVWKLLRLWINEGFIKKDGDTTLEDIAEEYLEDLVARHLLIVGRRNWNGNIRTCRIHDTLRDFCKIEASNQNLFTEIKIFDQSTFSSDHPNLKDYRRICMNSNVNDYVASKPSGHVVRSFLTFVKERRLVTSDHVSSIPKAFKLLRVLDVKSLIFTTFPPELTDMFLLKYIAMFCAFREIPENFSHLTNLQTIVFDTISGTLEIKADISKLALLRHLVTNASTSLGKSEGQSEASSILQTLCTISPESCTAELFKRYPKLKKLGIRGKMENIEEVFETFAKLELLENLKLINEINSPQLPGLPHENKFPRNLTRLTLMHTFLDWSQISTIGKLLNLEVLKLKDNAFDGELWDTEDGGFPCLKVLHIGSTQKLKQWNAKRSHFPKLTSLYLRDCANLVAIPSGIAFIPSLEIIDLYCTKPSVAVSARKIEVLKLKKQVQKKDIITSMFKLAVYPPEL